VSAGEKVEKQQDIGGVCLDTILGKSSFGDEIVEIEFVCCRELFGKPWSFDDASVVNQWLLFGEEGWKSILSVRLKSDT